MAPNGMYSRRWRSPDAGEFADVHVLAVDDSLIDRKVIERLLKITSCKVTAVESGWRALQYLGLDQEKTSSDFVNVDLIITDYCMPGMTGYELLKKIKGSANFREVPVVIMSSENVVARIDRCLEEGAEDFIVKPVKLSDVKRLKDYMFGAATTVHDNDNNNNNNNNNDINSKQEKTSFNKRKLQQMCDTPPSTSPSPPTSSPSPPLTTPLPPLTSPTPPSTSPSPPTTSPSPPTTSPSSPMTSPSPPTMSDSGSSSPLSPTMSPSTPPFSPSQLNSPTMRLKVTNSDQA